MWIDQRIHKATACWRVNRPSVALMLPLLFVGSVPVAWAHDVELAAVGIRVENVPIDVNIRGLGTVIGDGQVVLTSRHVVNNCPRLVVINHEGLPHHASSIAKDAQNDLAAIDVPTLEMSSLKVRHRPALKPKENVWYVKPQRFRPGLERIIVGSATVVDLARRGDSRILTLIGVSATGVSAFRAGDSGGPIVDVRGNLVGMVAGILPQMHAHANEFVRNIGFAINAGLIELFLSANKIVYQSSGEGAPAVGKPGETLLRNTVTVHCMR